MKHVLLLSLVFISAACLFVSACGAKYNSATSAPPRNMTGEPEFDIAGFGVLKEATTDAALPYLAGADGVRAETLCYAVTKNIQSWQTKNSSLLENFKKNDAAIKNAITAWIRNAIFVSDAPSNTEASWRIELKKPQIVHTKLENVRLQKDAQCIDEIIDTPHKSNKTVTTLFGALELHFESDTSLNAEILKKMRQAAKKASFRLKTDRYEYPRATDAGGKPLKDEKGRPLFQGPADERLLRHKIPKIKDRPVFTWKLVFSKPLFFAYGDLPSDAWAKELDPMQCSVNLIFDDATPRVPECTSTKDAGFGITASGSKETVIVKVTADGVTVEKEVRFHTREMIQVAGRIIVWVEPKELVEGATLNIDSLVLAPGSGPDNALDSFKKNKKRSPKKKTKTQKKKQFVPPISY